MVAKVDNENKKWFLSWLSRELTFRNIAFVLGIVFICGSLYSTTINAVAQVKANTIKIDCKVEETEFSVFVDETANRFERIEDKLDKILFYLVQKGK